MELLIIVPIIILLVLVYLSFEGLIKNLWNPVRHPPKYIHSFTPIIGFGLKMEKDPIEFIQSLHEQYGTVFSIRLLFKRYVFLSDKDTYLEALRSPDLSIDEFLNDLSVEAFGVGRQLLADKIISEERNRQFRRYLSGRNLENLNEHAEQSLIRSIELDKRSGPNRKHFFDFFGEMMLFAGCEGLFGEDFSETQRTSSPSFYTLFQDFDQTVKMAARSNPFWRYFHRGIYRNQQELIRRFSSLSHFGDLSELIQKREDLLRGEQNQAIVSEYDVAALQASMLWAAVSNTAPIACWILFDILNHPDVHRAVMNEIDENIDRNRLISAQLNSATLNTLDRCVNETMRRVFYAISTRQAIRQTEIECSDGTKVSLRKGDMLVYPAFFKHFDRQLFGRNPFEYNPLRLLNQDQERSFSLTVFGFGSHQCPGRFWAIKEIKIFIILVLRGYSINFVNLNDDDRTQFRERLPYDYSKFISTGGPTQDQWSKFEIECCDAQQLN